MFNWRKPETGPNATPSEAAKQAETLSEVELRALMEVLPLHNGRTPAEMGWEVASLAELKEKIMHLPLHGGGTPAELGWELAHLGGKQTVDEDGSVWTELTGFRDPSDPRTYTDASSQSPAARPAANPQEHPLWDEIDERGATIPFRHPEKFPMRRVGPGLSIDENNQLWDEMEPVKDRPSLRVFNDPRHADLSDDARSLAMTFGVEEFLDDPHRTRWKPGPGGLIDENTPGWPDIEEEARSAHQAWLDRVRDASKPKE